MRATTSSAGISPTLSLPTTSAAGLRPSRGSHPTSSSARHGHAARTLQAQSAPANAGTKHLIAMKHRRAIKLMGGKVRVVEQSGPVHWSAVGQSSPLVYPHHDVMQQPAHTSIT